MLTFPNCKINIGLNVIEKRSDSFHNIETIMFPIPWHDMLEIIPNENPLSPVEFKNSGMRVFGSKEKNLCLKAYYLLAEKYSIGSVSIHLHKIIPIGAGLGGGSSDATSTVMLLNKIFRMNLEEEAILSIVRQLGSDCAFFVQNKPAYATQKGDQFESISLKLKDHYLVLIKPRVHISTAEAYAGIRPNKKRQSLKELIRLPLEEWKHHIENDFEKNVFEKYTSIKNIKAKLYKLGALYASMSGSGSAVYGIFKEEKHVEAYFRSCIVWQGKL